MFKDKSKNIKEGEKIGSLVKRELFVRAATPVISARYRQTAVWLG
jgi:hypothetical protein